MSVPASTPNRAIRSYHCGRAKKLCCGYRRRFWPVRAAAEESRGSCRAASVNASLDKAVERSQLANSDIHDIVPERRAADARDLCRNPAAQAGRERRRVRPGRRAVPLVPVYVIEIRHLCGVRAHAAQRNSARDRNRSSALSAAAEDRDEFGAAGDFRRILAAAAATDPGWQRFRPDRCALFLSGRRCGGTAGPGARSARRDHGARRRPRLDCDLCGPTPVDPLGSQTCCRPYHRLKRAEEAA